MNQFKKAKQLRSESGQAIESITDLKTAGVTQKVENTEPSITEEKKIQPDNTSTDTLSDSRIIENNTLIYKLPSNPLQKQKQKNQYYFLHKRQTIQ